MTPVYKAPSAVETRVKGDSNRRKQKPPKGSKKTRVSTSEGFPSKAAPMPLIIPNTDRNPSQKCLPYHKQKTSKKKGENNDV